MGKFVRKADIFLLVGLLILCAAILLPSYFAASSKKDLTAVVMQNGEEVKEIALSDITEAYTFTLNTDPSVTIAVEPGCIYYASADCPDKVCVKTGKLTKAGDTAACLPSKTLIVIRGTAEKGQPDILTY